MRYLIKYTKGSDIKYVSHLELMRTIQRIIRRADLPAKYSQGFNPHMALSIAQPLAVGVYSRGEYMDVHFVEDLELDYVKEVLNQCAPYTIEFTDVKKIDESNNKVPQAMAAVEAARYILKFKLEDSINSFKDMEQIENAKEWIVAKKGKKGKTEEKSVDIKGLVKEFKYEIDNNILVIDVIVSCGSKANLSAQLLGEYMKNNIHGINKDAFIDIERQNMFAYKGEKLVPLNQYLK